MINNRISAIIVHLTNCCNLKCSYCYLQKNSEIIYLTNENIDTLIYSFKIICEYNRKRPIKVIFHGGEPLLVDVTLFENLLIQFLSINPVVRFGIQTNLTLLNERHIRLFQIYNFSVGFSLDGYNEKQNSFRINCNGKSVYQEVIENYRKLKINNVKCGAVISLNKYHIGHEKELLDFIQHNELKCNIRPFYPTSEVDKKYALTVYEYADFFTKIFDIWFEQDKEYDTFLVSEFVNYIKKFFELENVKTLCTQREECSNKYLCIDSNSNCYPCNRVYGIRCFYLGNLQTDSIDEIMNNNICKTGNRWNILSANECSKCEIASKCYGGCGAVAFSTQSSWYKKDYYCEAYKIISEHIRNVLNKREFDGIIL